MYSADVWFSRSAAGVDMVLRIGGETVATSCSPESIARELQIRAIRELNIEARFGTELPTSAATLERAADAGFTEPMAALKLIAECSFVGDTAAFPYPERRVRWRAQVPAVNTFLA